MAGTSYKEILQRISEEPPGYDPVPESIKSKKELQCREWFKQSFTDLRTFESILNRIEGKPTERIENDVSVNMNIKDITREIREFLIEQYPEAHEGLLKHLREKYNDGSC
ncbi:MAG: hypothetical protein AMS17_11070 [Spirochaetes bacterium DG_61]|nr:MAG: hypothetical protein AMS17_11070 [Spirochaetes bacterium DG_61]